MMMAEVGLLMNDPRAVTVTYESLRSEAEIEALCTVLGLDWRKVTTKWRDQNAKRYGEAA
jgi:hypothetical protein